MNRYWITFAEFNSYFINGYIYLWINKNPGSYDTDPSYPVLEPKKVISALFELSARLPNAQIEVKK